MRNINGCGTILYGEREEDKTDNSHVSTKWFVFFFLPIIPLGSYRVRELKSEVGFLSIEKKYQMEKIRFNWRQVFLTYFVGWLVLLPIAVACVSLFMWWLSEDVSHRGQ